ncbi:MAG: hypothetical protein JXA79_05070 [Deltaproteobacteria bacterium]|nr:hypothetical protein [Deltaproteobacteria bacterium]
MAGYNRGMVFKEVSDLLSEEELAEIAETERQEREGKIPKGDYLTELYLEFEHNNMDYLRTLTESVGIAVTMMEDQDVDRRDMLRSLIEQDTQKIEILRKEILNDRETLAELKRLSR